MLPLSSRATSSHPLQGPSGGSEASAGKSESRGRAPATGGPKECVTWHLGGFESSSGDASRLEAVPEDKWLVGRWQLCGVSPRPCFSQIIIIIVIKAELEMEPPASEGRRGGDHLEFGGRQIALDKL